MKFTHKLIITVTIFASLIFWACRKREVNQFEIRLNDMSGDVQLVEISKLPGGEMFFLVDASKELTVRFDATIYQSLKIEFLLNNGKRIHSNLDLVKNGVAISPRFKNNKVEFELLEIDALLLGVSSR